MDVINAQGFAVARCRAADAVADADADAGSLALKRPEHQFIVDHPVKARPVHVRQIFPQQRCDIGHIRNNVRLARGQRIGSADEFAVEFVLGCGAVDGKVIHDFADKRDDRQCLS